ncbi:hypothetical protein Patl1_36417 [Pistacia atlantica]|nr:hypothetical protein Patl1_36417 [Pistacia atlantica]
MVNCFLIYKSILHGAMKLVGMTTQAVEIEPGTVLNFWVPTETTNRTKNKTNKPAVVFLHGFAFDGILNWQFQGAEEAWSGELHSCRAQLWRDPDLVESMVVTCTVMALTESVNNAALRRVGFSSSPENLLPKTAEGVKTLLDKCSYRFLRFHNFFYREMLETMFNHRKERTELLQALVISDEQFTIPHFPQLGEKATLKAIKKAGHIVNLERPCVYNRNLKRILGSFTQENAQHS